MSKTLDDTVVRRDAAKTIGMLNLLSDQLQSKSEALLPETEGTEEAEDAEIAN